MSTVSSKDQVIAEMQRLIEDMRNDEEISLVMISRKDSNDTSALKIVTARADMEDVRKMIEDCLAMTDEKHGPNGARIH